jgi:hypothetical protein
MSDLQPRRLLASEHTDDELRAALRVIVRDAPDAHVLAKLADDTQRALHHAHAREREPSSALRGTAWKWMALSVICAGMVFGGLQWRQAHESHELQELQESPRNPQRVSHAAGAARVETHAQLPVYEDQRVSRDTVTAAVEAPTHSGVMTAQANEVAVPARASASVESGLIAASEPHAVVSVSSASSQPTKWPRVVAARVPSSSSAKPRARDRRDDTHLDPQAPTASWRAGVPSETVDAPLAPARDEVDLLESAQRFLARDPRRALALLLQHRAAYVRGAFAQERDVLMLDALSRLGDIRAARNEARAFLQRYPSSPHRARAQALLDDGR